MPVRLRVLRTNPARELYERLGFRIYGTTETHHLMIVHPRAAEG
jgi:ribosomal protein S18 acetylase RimI-like enzyme